MGRSRGRTTSLAVLLTLVGLVAGCGSAGPASPEQRAADRRCRSAFATLWGIQGEDGSLAAPDNPLDRRWKREFDRAYQLSREATAADCAGELRAMKRRFSALTELGSVSGDVDMTYLLSLAERDLEHAKATRDYDPLPPRLAEQFTRLGALAPPARAALQPALTAAAATDLDDPGAVRASVRRPRRTAAATPEVQASLGVLDEIADWELSEE